MPDSIRLAVIVGSTRPVRVGPAVAGWFAGRARRRPGVELDLIDLAEVALPFLSEPEHPAYGRYTEEHTLAWSKRVAGAEAYVLVTPEYNASFPAALKNALDTLYAEWNGKPVGFVGYGGPMGGARAVYALRPVVGALGMLPVGPDVAVHRARRMLDDDGVLQATDELDETADLLLTELVALTVALRSRHQADPALTAG
jgi:NAD(P)H-dependent FMN reductase